MKKDNDTHIKIDVQLDENKIPEKITWSAPDGGVNKADAQALLMSLWDGKKPRNIAHGSLGERDARRSDECLLSSVVGHHGANVLQSHSKRKNDRHHERLL